MLYKNGTADTWGNDLVGAGGNGGWVVSGLIYLTANQYVEVNFYGGGTVAAFSVGAATCLFEGFFVRS